VVAIDSTIITNAPREPLTEADLADLSLTDLLLELPLTGNKVSRDPVPLAARSFVEQADVSETEGFDRVTFTFSSATPFPGYQISIVDTETPVMCGEEEKAFDVDGDRALMVILEPARTSSDGRTGPRMGTRALGQPRFGSGGLHCDDGRAITWVAGLSEGDEVRVLELRNPLRLVVDVR
jgi:hypothetical protein